MLIRIVWWKSDEWKTHLLKISKQYYSEKLNIELEHPQCMIREGSFICKAMIFNGDLISILILTFQSIAYERVFLQSKTSILLFITICTLLHGSSLCQFQNSIHLSK